MRDRDGDADLIAIDDADNWLHLGLAAGMIALRATLSRTDRARADGADAGAGSRI